MTYWIDITPYPSGKSLAGFPHEINAPDEKSVIASYEEELPVITGDYVARLYIKTEKGEVTVRTNKLGR